MAAWANDLLDRTGPMSDRRALADVLGLQIQKWNLTSDGKSVSISANGAEDTQHLSDFLRDNPQALEELGRSLPAHNDIAASMMAIIDASVAANARGAMSAQAMPLHPMKMSAAFDKFAASKTSTAENNARTVKAKRVLLDKMVAHYVENGGNADPYVHDIATTHLSAFLDTTPIKSRKGKPGSDSPEAHSHAAPKTVIKKISDLTSFFAFAKEELNACVTDPTAGLQNRLKALNKAASNQERHYKAFNDQQLAHLFEPRAYLSFNRDPDYFWTPLLALHLGTRLAELVTLELTSIACQAKTKLWTIEVTDENAKNSNSRRIIPIPDALVDLGFIEYVKHVQGLGATHLFPHRDATTATFLADPSKNTRRNWGEYLDHRDTGHEELGLGDPDLVFHSFRHTVVSALRDGLTPLADSMQLVGHQAQEHAIKMGDITAQQARSVHTSDYTHADSERMGVDNPLARLKGHLDRCIKPPIDYPRLKLAAQVVQEHLKRRDGKFAAGWSKLKAAYTEAQLSRIG